MIWVWGLGKQNWVVCCAVYAGFWLYYTYVLLYYIEGLLAWRGRMMYTAITKASSAIKVGSCMVLQHG